MKRFFLLAVFAVVAGCGTEPEVHKQDSRLYGVWLFRDIDIYKSRTGAPKSRVDILWEFDAEKILWRMDGFDYTHTDTAKVSASGEYCCWYTSNGELFFTDADGRLMKPVETRVGYAINETGGLTYVSLGSRVQGEKEWEYAHTNQCNLCGAEATKQ